MLLVLNGENPAFLKFIACLGSSLIGSFSYIMIVSVWPNNIWARLEYEENFIHLLIKSECNSEHNVLCVCSAFPC